MTFESTVHVYYQDTDAQGIVYHANYLDFAERARTDMMYRLGLNNQTLIQRDIGMVIRHVDIDYLSPARLEDDLTIKTDITTLNRVSMTLTQTFFHQNQQLVSVHIKIAFISLTTFRPVRLPDDIALKLKGE